MSGTLVRQVIDVHPLQILLKDPADKIVWNFCRPILVLSLLEDLAFGLRSLIIEVFKVLTLEQIKQTVSLCQELHWIAPLLIAAKRSDYFATADIWEDLVDLTPSFLFRHVNLEQQISPEILAIGEQYVKHFPEHDFDVFISDEFNSEATVDLNLDSSTLALELGYHGKIAELIRLSPIFETEQVSANWQFLQGHLLSGKTSPEIVSQLVEKLEGKELEELNIDDFIRQLPRHPASLPDNWRLILEKLPEARTLLALVAGLAGQEQVFSELSCQEEIKKWAHFFLIKPRENLIDGKAYSELTHPLAMHNREIYNEFLAQEKVQLDLAVLNCYLINESLVPDCRIELCIREINKCMARGLNFSVADFWLYRAELRIDGADKLFYIIGTPLHLKGELSDDDLVREDLYSGKGIRCKISQIFWAINEVNSTPLIFEPVGEEDVDPEEEEFVE